MRRGAGIAGSIMALIAAGAVSMAAEPLVASEAPPRRRVAPHKTVKKPKVPVTDHDEMRLVMAANRRKAKAARQAKGMRP